MKRVLLLLIIFGVNFLQVAGQNPSGFNYQAVIRSSNGEIIQNQSVGIRISILKGGVTGEAVYVETFSTETNNFGLVNLVIGTGNPKEGALSDVEWSSDSHFIKVEIDIQGGSNYTEMGTSQLLSVPYAMHAKSASQFKGEPNGDPDAPLFEIKNSKGEIVFAVYENGVKIFIDEDEDGKTVGGFAVSGRTTTKEVQDLLTVAPGETRVYVDESSGKTVGGFAVSGRTTTKEVEDILHITTDNTQIYVGEGNGKTVGGFAVSGRTTTKEVEDILQITPENTQIYVGEGNGKTVGGFAVSGRTTTKEVEDILHITPENTQIYVGEGNGKTVGGFAVSGRTTTKEVEDILQITPENTQIYVGEGNGKTVGGFAVSGRTTTKGVEDILQITPDNTRIYVSESDGKTVGGFAVSGRTTTKEEGFYDVLKVVPERTDVFIKPPAGKLFPDGFSVSVYNEQLVPTELFNVSEEGIFMNNEVVMVPNVVTGDTTDQTQTSIYAEGTVLPYNGSPISYRGITYSTAPNPVANFQSEPSWEMGTVIDGNMMGDGFGEFYVYLDGLNPGTLYYYKAFAINEDGQIGYGAQKTFETADPYLLTFTVLETGTGIPIDNAMITIELGDKRITNPAGEYGFQVEEGYWMYSVMAEGYYLIEEEAYVFSDETVTVELDPADYSVVFTVTNASGDPLAGITIYIEEGGETNYCETNGRGIALYNPSEPGEYPFNIYSDNHLPYSGSFEVTDNTTVNVPITLQEIVTHKVTFYVQTPEGNPCQGATIELIPVYKNEGGKAYDPYRITDENGYAIYEDLLPHPTYNYTVNYLSYPVVIGSISITDHDVEETVQLLDGK